MTRIQFSLCRLINVCVILAPVANYLAGTRNSVLLPGSTCSFRISRVSSNESISSPSSLRTRSKVLSYASPCRVWINPTTHTHTHTPTLPKLLELLEFASFVLRERIQLQIFYNLGTSVCFSNAWCLIANIFHGRFSKQIFARMRTIFYDG